MVNISNNSHKLPYDGQCEVSLTVKIHSTEKEVHNVIIDTGLLTSSTYGLKVPFTLLDTANFTLTGTVALADGKPMNIKYIPAATITSLQGIELKKKVSVPTIFLGKRPLIGMMFLQTCLMNLDGPKKQAFIQWN